MKQKVTIAASTSYESVTITIENSSAEIYGDRAADKTKLMTNWLIDEISNVLISHGDVIAKFKHQLNITRE